MMSPEQIAGLTNYDAQARGLPSFMEAVLVVSVEGRIDMPGFHVKHSIEPFNHMHPWVSYRREGALLFAGERQMRLHLQQLRVLEAIEALAGAGTNVAARLRAWPALVEALHMPGRNYVLVMSDLPHMRVSTVAALPAQAMTRVGKTLAPVTTVPNAAWAMQAGRRYYLQAS